MICGARRFILFSFKTRDTASLSRATRQKNEKSQRDAGFDQTNISFNQTVSLS
jgi:hypothetical protein